MIIKLLLYLIFVIVSFYLIIANALKIDDKINNNFLGVSFLLFVLFGTIFLWISVAWIFIFN
jgi:hypothetical protein